MKKLIKKTATKFAVWREKHPEEFGYVVGYGTALIGAIAGIKLANHIDKKLTDRQWDEAEEDFALEHGPDVTVFKKRDGRFTCFVPYKSDE